MAFFIGNSFCNLCQKDKEALIREMLICSKGLRLKGLLVKYSSARLPGDDDIIFERYNKHQELLHNAIYANRPDINSIFHVKSSYIYAATRDGLIDTVHAEATLVLGDVVITRDNSISNISRAAIGEPLRPIRIIIYRDEVFGLGACIHESRAFLEIMDEWARVKVIAKAFGEIRYPITLELLRSLGSRYARAIKFGGRNAKPM
jgi:ribulose-5-phosphate 4-epimerase/fuculose-1-phosphate aldolase